MSRGQAEPGIVRAGGRPPTLSTGRARHGGRAAKAEWGAHSAPTAGKTPPRFPSLSRRHMGFAVGFLPPAFHTGGLLLYFNTCFYGNIYGACVAHKTTL